MSAVGEEAIRVALENLRGQITRLDTVVRMSTAEQKRVNGDLVTVMQRLESQNRGLDCRLDKQEHRLATYTGGIMALWVIFQVAYSVWR